MGSVGFKPGLRVLLATTDITSTLHSRDLGRAEYFRSTSLAAGVPYSVIGRGEGLHRMSID